MSYSLQGWLLLTLALLNIIGCSRGETTKKDLQPGETAFWDCAPEGVPTGSFTRLSAAETGIDFYPRLDSDHPRARLYHSVFATGGVAVGDIDGDEIPDVFCTGGPNANKLYRQVSPFKFKDITDAAGIINSEKTWSVGASLVDVDNDFDLDLYVCNYDSPNQLWINDGKGQFENRAAEYGVDFKDASVMAYFGDFDNDGFVDLYLLTNRLYYGGALVSKFNIRRSQRTGELLIEKRLEPYYRLIKKPNNKYAITQRGRPDRLFRNHQGRRFVDSTEASGIKGDGHGLSAILWDYDQDHDLDIYVCNGNQDPDCLYQNQGGGKFVNVIDQVFMQTSSSSTGSDIADINNDGLTDLLTVDVSGSTHFLSEILSGGAASDSQPVDKSGPRQYSRNLLHLNAGKCIGIGTNQYYGQQRYLETAQISGIDRTDWSWAPVFGDFDNDGFCDLFVSNGHIRNFRDPDAADSRGVSAAEDTQWNIFKYENRLPQNNAAFRNINGMQFEPCASGWNIDHAGMSYSTASADLDRDGDLDMIVMNLDEPIGVYRNDISDANRLTIELVGSRSNRSGLGAKVRIQTDRGIQIKEHSPYRGIVTSHQPLMHFGLGNEDVVNQIDIEWPSGNVQTLYDVAANQRVAIREPARNPRTKETKSASMFQRVNIIGGLTHKERIFDDYSKLQPLLPHKLSQLGPGVSFLDINQDGKDDVYVSAPAFNSSSIGLRDDVNLLDTSRATFAAQLIPTKLFKEEYTTLFFDVDGDGDTDMYIVNGGIEYDSNAEEPCADRLIVMDANRTFADVSERALPANDFPGAAAAVADYDRDGDLDLFVGGRLVKGMYPTSPRSMLLRNVTTTADEPRFVDATSADGNGLESPGMVTSALWSDVNDDGWIDLLLTLEWGPIRLFMNRQGKLIEQTKEAGLADCTGWWNGIAGRDVDNDGDIDYVATNFGLNSEYRVSQTEPNRIYFGKFGSNDQSAIIHTKVDGQSELPISGRNRLERALPFIRDKFPTYGAFASCRLIDICAESELSFAQVFEATELTTSLLINDGSGKFEIRALPLLAQLSPGFGVAMTDLNADGNTDIYVAQNFFSAQRERMAGGLGALLLGNGDGSFNEVWPSKSGLAIEADAMSLAVGDLDNDMRPDLLVGINNEEARLYHNRSTGNYPLKIRLEGSQSNLRAIGARVTLVMASGAMPACEVTAGGGYLSQSTSDLFFGLNEHDSIQQIHVRWPDGSESELAPPMDLDGPFWIVKPE